MKAVHQSLAYLRVMTQRVRVNRAGVKPLLGKHLAAANTDILVASNQSVGSVVDPFMRREVPTGGRHTQ